MSYRCYEDIKTQASAWEAALAAVESRAEDLEKLFAEEPGELLFAAAAPRTTWVWPTPPSGGSG